MLHYILNLPDLREQCAGPHPGLLHASYICWADVVQELCQQRKQDLI